MRFTDEEFLKLAFKGLQPRIEGEELVFNSPFRVRHWPAERRVPVSNLYYLQRLCREMNMRHFLQLEGFFENGFIVTEGVPEMLLKAFAEWCAISGRPYIHAKESRQAVNLLAVGDRAKLFFRHDYQADIERIIEPAMVRDSWASYGASCLEAKLLDAFAWRTTRDEAFEFLKSPENWRADPFYIEHLRLKGGLEVSE